MTKEELEMKRLELKAKRIEEECRIFKKPDVPIGWLILSIGCMAFNLLTWII